MNHSIKKPNFYIVGAPKCGTTTMYYWLKQHPQICMAGRKELHFFGSDLIYRGKRDFMHIPREENEWRRYFDFFPCIDRPIVGDVSVFYLYSKYAAQEIYSFNPEAKILIMLRNPVDVVISMFWQNKKIGVEPESDLEKAIFRSKPPNVNHTFIAQFDYIGLARFSEQIQRYLNIFPREQIKIILLEDFRRDAYAVLQDVYEFLGVETLFPEDMKPRNQFSSPNPFGINIFRWLSKPWMRKIGRVLVPYRPFRWKIADLLRGFFRERSYSERPKISEGLVEKIQSHLGWDLEIQKLQRLLGRQDLQTLWSQPSWL